IDRDSPAAKFVQEFWRRQTADFGRPPQRYLFALIEADGDVHQGITFVQRDVGQPLAWNRDRHFDDEGSARGEIWEAQRPPGFGAAVIFSWQRQNRERLDNDAEESQRWNPLSSTCLPPPVLDTPPAPKVSDPTPKPTPKTIKN